MAADWGQTWQSLAKVGPTASQLGPSLRRTFERHEPQSKPQNLAKQRIAWSQPQIGPSLGADCPGQGPKLRNVGPTWCQDGVMLGWSWAQVDPDGPQMEAMWCTWMSESCSTWRSLAPFGDSFAPSWAQRRHNMGNIAQHEASSVQKKVENWKRVLWRFRIGPAMFRVLSPRGAQLGPKLLPNVQLEASWASLAKVDPKLHPCCRHVGSKPRIWTMLGNDVPIRKNVRITSQSRALFVDLLGPKMPLRPQLVEQAVDSYHLLLNYHASAPFLCKFWRQHSGFPRITNPSTKEG